MNAEHTIAVNQEYFCPSDVRTRRVTYVSSSSVVFVCLDCATISIEKETTMSLKDFVMKVKDKVFVLKELKVKKTEKKKVEAVVEEKIEEEIKTEKNEQTESKPKIEQERKSNSSNRSASHFPNDLFDV